MLDFKGRCLTGYDRQPARGRGEQRSEAEASKPMRFILLVCYCLISVLRQFTLFLSTSAASTWKGVLHCAAVFSGKREHTDLLFPFITSPTSSHLPALPIYTAVGHPDPAFHDLMQRDPSCSGKAPGMVTLQTPLHTREPRMGVVATSLRRGRLVSQSGAKLPSVTPCSVRCRWGQVSSARWGEWGTQSYYQCVQTLSSRSRCHYMLQFCRLFPLVAPI